MNRTPLTGALAAALASLPLSGCHRHKLLVVEQARQRLEGVQLSQSTVGKPAWNLRARAATLEDNDKVAVLDAPEVAFFKDRKQVSTVSALGGVMRTDTYDVILSTRVVVHGLEDNTTLLTEELRYSSTRKKFFTDRDVLVKRPGGTLRGKGMEASPDLSDIRVYNQRTVIDEAPR